MKYLTDISSGAVYQVALFTRAWIEIDEFEPVNPSISVALFTRAWIEIILKHTHFLSFAGRPLHEGVD